MYFVSLHGHETSCLATPASSTSGKPTECRHGTKSPNSPISSSAGVPMRVMMCMLNTTYGESVISTPSWEMREPSGPMEYGMTYMVRPRIDPANRPFKVARISLGSAQLFVGPASTSRCEQMKVLCSTRATSLGSLRARNEFGRRSGFSLMRVPASTSSPVSRSHSWVDPSHHSMLSGCVNSATPSTHSRSCLLRVGASSNPCSAIVTPLSDRVG